MVCQIIPIQQYIVRIFKQHRNVPSKKVKASSPYSCITTVNILLYSSIKIILLIPEYMVQKI